MDKARVSATLLPLYHRAGGRDATGIHEMLRRIADDSSRLLRLHAFPATFERVALEVVTADGAQMESELRLDLLALACEAGFSELAAALLGIGIAWRNGDAYQCMVLAIEAGHLATLALLLRAGIDAALRGECGTPLLTHAIAAGDAAIVDMLRKAGARADSEGSALSAAAVGGWSEMIRMCMDDGASPTALGDALDQAAMAGRHQAVIQLLQAGAPLDPALLRATQRGDDEMADLICTARAGQLLASGAGRLAQR
ncbi:MAG: ankyrin repeat domain-containing protein [Oxalobacteraceae bacterium]|nr:MAG: ankyrin repeat domain-containing protein [Oxalobacteraceae bacterium]